MRLVDLQPIGSELALKWEDGAEHFISARSRSTGMPLRFMRGRNGYNG